MSHWALRILIGIVLALFVIVTLAFQSICAPDKNPASAAVSAYVEKTFTESQAPTKPVDPLSYDGLKKVIVRWFSAYCGR
jgi:hypothetical protein